MNRFIVAIATLGITTTAQAQAQTPAQGPSQAQPAGAAVATIAKLGGAAVPGMCFLSREGVYANAKVGKAATGRLRELAQQAQAEVDADRRPIDADIQAFNTEAPKLSADQRATRQQALAARLQPVDGKAAQRQREINATRAKVLERISVAIEPVLADVYRQRNCGLLIDRDAVIGGNMANDLTAAVVQGLDARIQTMPIERETLAAVTPPAAAARP